MKSSISDMTAARDQMQQYVGYMKSMPDETIPGGKTILDFIPDNVKNTMSDDMTKQLGNITVSFRASAMV